MKHSSNRREVIFGGEPTAHLLPPELKAKRHGRVLHRAMTAGLIGVVLIMSVAIGLTSFQATLNRGSLAAAHLRTDEILRETANFTIMRQLEDQYEATRSVQALGASTEVDWQAYLSEIRSILPADVSLDSITVAAGSPWTSFGQSDRPLAEPRTATLTLQLTSSGLPAVSDWLIGLRDLPGYADARPGSITRSETGSYRVDITLNINQSARSHRFAIGE
jgi:Tfp pilus assembly protein PilN